MRRTAPLLLLAVTACSGSSPAPAPLSERIVYRVIDDTGQASTTTVDVSPPYRARSVNRSETGAVTGGFAWDAGGLYTISPSGTAQTASIAPGFPGPYSGLAIALPVAERQHLVRRVGRGEVLGMACEQWVSAEPLDGAPFAPAAGGDRATSCVDDDGWVLAETWYVGGKLARTRTATEVGPGPSIAGPALHDGAPTPLPSTGSGYVVRDTPRADLVRLLQVPAPPDPAGFRPDASVAVLDLDAAATGFTREAAVLTWLRGSDLVVLRLERDLSGTSKGTVRGAPVDLGVLGTGHLEPVFAGLRVVVDGPTGLRALVTADLPEDELLAWVKTLRFRSGP